MLTTKRLSIVSAAVGIGMLLGAAPALAGDNYGNVNCSQTPSPLCDLGAGTSGDPNRPGGNGGSNKPGRPGGNDSSTGRPSKPGDTIVGGDSGLASCSYLRSDYQPPSGGVVTAAYKPPTTNGGVVHAAVFRPTAFRAQAAQPGQGPGAWYVWQCTTQGVTDGLYRPPVWIADGQQPGAALLPSPAELAQMARKQLRLPSPSIAANPAGDQLVNLPTWMWLSGGWGPVSATASVPGVSVTAVATPTSVTWATGDGSTVTCTGAGTPYKAGTDPKAPSPDCGHVYRRSSASQPGQAYPVTATVHWTVTWSGAGQGGTFPDMTTTGNATFRVAESQALNNGGG
ncbi:hypothetical protein [Actinokineospora terrae]|uniref:ATP/GTP-binding protein n=1 Tax=Actinokineospora terrae TaxID=155974 RepID=A0A1H9WRS6_9PSEU|nr:hypothetical protein [Actinokineospora terrae]SES36093.1 hypothetical protein SAMN04487818_11181 [Actinokineospora terrae]